MPSGDKPLGNFVGQQSCEALAIHNVGAFRRQGVDQALEVNGHILDGEAAGGAKVGEWYLHMLPSAGTERLTYLVWHTIRFPRIRDSEDFRRCCFVLTRRKARIARSMLSSCAYSLSGELRYR